MNTKEFTLLGEIIKTRGYKGEVQVVAHAGAIEPFIQTLAGTEEKMEPVFLKIDGILVPFFLEDAEFIADDLLSLKISGINTPDEARKYFGKKVYTKRGPDELAETDSDMSEYVGYEAFTQNGQKVGAIKEFHDMKGNWVFLVASEEEEVYLPAHPELILEIDSGKRKLVISVPEGLI